MKTLETSFRFDGYTFRQVKRQGDVALFAKTSTGGSGREFYEVVKVQSHDGFEIAGNKFPPAESMPSSNSWGTLGWSYSDLVSAEKKFAELTA